MYTHTHTHTYIYVCVYVCIYAHAHIYAYMYISVLSHVFFSSTYFVEWLECLPMARETWVQSPVESYQRL